MLVSESVPYGRNEAMGLMFPGFRPGGQAALPAVYTLEECRLRSLVLPVAAYVMYLYKKYTLRSRTRRKRCFGLGGSDDFWVLTIRSTHLRILL